MNDWDVWDFIDKMMVVALCLGVFIASAAILFKLARYAFGA